jgi:hypothetical protein
MGSSYSSLTLRGPERGRVIEALRQRRREAFVGPAAGDLTVVYDEESENDPEAVAALAADLTRELGGAALAVTIHDDDVLTYALVRDGAVVDGYDSCPGYFGEGEAPPAGGDAAALAQAFGRPEKAAELERILRAPAGGGDYLFESGRHWDLADSLGLPEHSVNLGYKYVYQGEAEELEPQMAHVGAQPLGERDVSALVDRRLERAGIDPAAAQGPGAMNPGAMDPGAIDFGAIPGLGGLDPALMAQMQAAAEAMVSALQHPAHSYYQSLAAGDAETIRSFFLGDVILDDPLSGRVEGDEALAAHVAVAQQVLGARMMTYAPYGVLETDERIVAEGMIVLGPFPMSMVPAAVVWERAPEGGYAAARAYYSLAALTGTGRVRPPVLGPDPSAPLPEAMAAHLRALAGESAEAVAATFAPGCLERARMMGLPGGAEAAQAMYGARLGAEGVVSLEACTAAGDGRLCAVEFVATRWDGRDIEPQAGLLVAELDGGKPCTVRVYGELGPAPAGMPDMSALLGGMGSGMGGMGGGFPPMPAGGGGMPDLSALFGGGGGLPGSFDDDDLSDGEEDDDDRNRGTR